MQLKQTKSNNQGKKKPTTPPQTTTNQPIIKPTTKAKPSQAKNNPHTKKCSGGQDLSFTPHPKD